MKVYFFLRIVSSMIFSQIFTEAMVFSVQGINECPDSTYITKTAFITYEVQCATMCRVGYSCHGTCLTETLGGYMCSLFFLDVNVANGLKVPQPNTIMHWAADLAGFVRFGNKAYRHSTTLVDFDTAVSACSLLKSNLAAPMTAAEANDLKLISGDDLRWIYVTDIETEGVYVDGITGLPYSTLVLDASKPTSTTTNCVLFATKNMKMIEDSCTGSNRPYTCVKDMNYGKH